MSLYQPPVSHRLHSGYSQPLLREWQQDNTSISPAHLMYPIFVVDGKNQKQEIPALPEQYRWSVDRLTELLDPLVKRGLRSVLIFGVPQHMTKDSSGSCATATDSPVQAAVALIRRQYKDVLVACDLCLCAYTDHGHCGIIDGATGELDNQQSIDRLAAVAVSYAAAGCQLISPSDMMDGRVGAIKAALAHHRLGHVAVMAYSIKFASCFYGPFRDAAASAPAMGDRKKYQLPPGAGPLGLRALQRDIAEGADIVMVKPGLPYLDLVAMTKQQCNLPVAVYNVSGEYAMIFHAAAKGSFDLRTAVFEMTTAFRRAGATIVITYFTPRLLEWLHSPSHL